MGLDPDQVSLRGGLVPIVHASRVAMHMPVEALFAAVGHLHRSPGSQGQQAQMHVEAEVLTGTERTTNPGQRQADLVLGQTETGCHLVAVLV